MKHLFMLISLLVLILGMVGCLAPIQPTEPTQPCQHTYIENIAKEATVVVDGEKQFTCSACGDSYSEMIPATKSLKVLYFGNSFGDDSLWHLWDICKSGGAEEVVLANLHIGGCDIATHWGKMKLNEPAYIYYKNSNGTWTEERNKKPHDALAEEDWNIVIFAQSSFTGMGADTFRRFPKLMELVREHVDADTQFWYNMTWAYQANCTIDAFELYNNDQMTQYDKILSSTHENVLTQPEIAGILPSGTAIQNLRTSFLGDNLTRDGYHLDRQIGSYVVGLVLYEKLTGGSAMNVEWAPPSINHSEKTVNACKEAAANAIKAPYEITESTYK